MYLKFKNNSKLKRRQLGALLGTGAMLALAGCSGGSSNGSGNNANLGLPAATVVALTDDNRLITFNSRTPGNASDPITITGLTAGDTIQAIDYRFPSTLGGGTGLYAIGSNAGSYQLYSIASGGAATAVGTRFTPSSANGPASIDFNPVVDRIRYIQAGDNLNLRLNPDDGTVAATDTSLAYAVGDTNAGQEPDVTGAAYTNVDADGGTSTTLYVIDAARNTLALQGSIGGTPTSPNSGLLTTVANLTVDPTNNSGFDIPGTSNTGILSINKRIYGIDLATGATTGGVSVETPSNTQIIDIAVVQ